MFREVKSAVDFLANILRTAKVNVKSIETFQRTLQNLLCNHYKNHWFPEKPFKGSGYRCIRINHKMDPLIAQAGSASDLSVQKLHATLPTELTLWIDPKDVSYRIGEEGSVGVLYSAQSAAGASTSDEISYPSATTHNASANWGQQTTCKDQHQLSFSNLIHGEGLNHLAQYVAS